MDIKYELIPYDGFIGSKEFDFDKAIYDLNSQIELLSSQADNLDYVVAIASGIACGLALYLSDDERTKKTFEKLEKISKIEENILNVSWDIYHMIVSY